MTWERRIRANKVLKSKPWSTGSHPFILTHILYGLPHPAELDLKLSRQVGFRLWKTLGLPGARKQRCCITASCSHNSWTPRGRSGKAVPLRISISNSPEQHSQRKYSAIPGGSQIGHPSDPPTWGQDQSINTWRRTSSDASSAAPGCCKRWWWQTHHPVQALSTASGQTSQGNSPSQTYPTQTGPPRRCSPHECWARSRRHKWGSFFICQANLNLAIPLHLLQNMKIKETECYRLNFNTRPPCLLAAFLWRATDSMLHLFQDMLG